MKYKSIYRELNNYKIQNYYKKRNKIKKKCGNRYKKKQYKDNKIHVQFA